MTRPWLPRGAGLWLGVRLMASAVVQLAGGSALRPDAGRSTLLVVVAVAACFAQTARLREWALLGNLGITRLALAATFAVPAIAGELALALVASAAR